MAGAPLALAAALLGAAGAQELTPAELGPYRSCLSLGDDALAIDECRRALAEGLPDARAAIALQMMGVRLAALGRWEEAVDAYRRWVARAPDSAAARRRLGEALLSGVDRVEEALAVLDQSVRLDPEDARTHGFRGIALNALGRHADAQRAFEDALVHDPTYFTSRPAARRVLEASQRGERWPLESPELVVPPPEVPEPEEP